jgi:hypothetical protein
MPPVTHPKEHSKDSTETTHEALRADPDATFRCRRPRAFTQL